MDIVGIIATIVLLAANFFFVGAEFALISARRSIVEPMALEGSRRAKMTLWALENVSLVMAGAQLGITVCSLALGYVTKPLVKTAVEPGLSALGMPEVWIDVVSYAIAYAAVTYLHVVLGEMVPKNMALAGPEKLALILGPTHVVIVRLLQPVLWTMNAMGNGVLRLFGVTPKNEVTSAFSRNEVAGLVSESREGGLLDQQDERLLLGALQLEAEATGKVAIPMDQVRTLPRTATPADVENAAVEGFSRFPLTDGDKGFAGYVHVKDVLGASFEERTSPIAASSVRALPVVDEGAPLASTISSMQADGAHLALVKSQDDAVIGIVTLEDVLEALVGQIRHEAQQQPR